MSNRIPLSFLKKFWCKLVKRKCIETTLRDTIEELIEEDECAETQSIDEDEREILGNVLNLRDIEIQDIMIPRVEIIALPFSAKIEELITEFVESQKSSILVYQGTIDNIIGVVFLKDVANWFHMCKPFNINLFIKEVLFVPPAMKTLDLLLQMKESGFKIAIVVDEYGGIDGMVTLSDIVENIIGDIQDLRETKVQKSKVTREADGAVVVDAKSTLSEIAKLGGIKIISKDKTIDTIGGFVFSQIGKIPVRGELVFCSDQKLEFEILDADPRCIKSMRIRRK